MVVVFADNVKVSFETAAVAPAIFMFASPMLCAIENALVAEPVVVTAETWRSCAFSDASELWFAAGVQLVMTFAKECPESFVNQPLRTIRVAGEWRGDRYEGLISHNTYRCF